MLSDRWAAAGRPQTHALAVGHVRAPGHAGVQGPHAVQRAIPSAPHAEPGTLERHLFSCGEWGWEVLSLGHGQESFTTAHLSARSSPPLLFAQPRPPVPRTIGSSASAPLPPSSPSLGLCPLSFHGSLVPPPQGWAFLGLPLLSVMCITDHHTLWLQNSYF